MEYLNQAWLLGTEQNSYEEHPDDLESKETGGYSQSEGKGAVWILVVTVILARSLGPGWGVERHVWYDHVRKVTEFQVRPLICITFIWMKEHISGDSKESNVKEKAEKNFETCQTLSSVCSTL